MEKKIAFILALCLMATLAACGRASNDDVHKTSITIDEIAEGTYTGTMPGDDYVNSDKNIFTTVFPAELTITIEKGQITLYCEAKNSAYGMLEGEKTPQSPDGLLILSGSLPLKQSDDTVTAEGEVPILGEMLRLHYNGSTFISWELIKHEGDKMSNCTVLIAMENGVPVATITAEISTCIRTASVPLSLVL